MSNGNGMTSGEMLRELWQDFRDFKQENSAAHDRIGDMIEKQGNKLAEIDKQASVNKTQIGVFTSIVAIIVTALVTFGLDAFGG